jgi:uncharacterized protein YicC (UPF0701 family)
MDMVRTVLREIVARAKRPHDAQRDKVADKMVADLEAIVANMKRAREAEGRSAADGYTYPPKWRDARR